jgi:hypothetical protein
MIVISGLMLALLLTSNSSGILQNNFVIAQYYGNQYGSSSLNFLCSDSNDTLFPGITPDMHGNPDGDSNSQSKGEESKSSDAKPSGKPGKVTTPPPSSASTPQPKVNQVGNPDVDSKSKGSIINDVCNEFGESGETSVSPIGSGNTDGSNVPSISCGQVIDESIQLTANLNCKTDGILVSGGDVTVDLNGFTVTGPGQNSSKIGIMVTDTKNVTVKGPGTISDFQAGVLITSGENSNISAVDLTNNHVGTFVSGSTDSNIMDNRLRDNNIGIATYSSSDSNIITNFFESNNLGGVTLIDSNNNDIYLNTVQDSLNGIFTDGQSHSNNVTYNNLKHETRIGINNDNGLPININNNEYDHNSCNAPLPNGLCYGNEQPTQNSGPSTSVSVEQSETSDQTPGEDIPSNPPEVESDESSSASSPATDDALKGLGSGNNVAVQSQNNGGSNSAGLSTIGSGSDSFSDSSGSGSTIGAAGSTIGAGETGSQTSGTTGGTKGSLTGNNAANSTFTFSNLVNSTFTS